MSIKNEHGVLEMCLAINKNRFFFMTYMWFGEMDQI